jgi:hypothetical protein
MVIDSASETIASSTPSTITRGAYSSTALPIDEKPIAETSVRAQLRARLFRHFDVSRILETWKYRREAGMQRTIERPRKRIGPPDAAGFLKKNRRRRWAAQFAREQESQRLAERQTLAVIEENLRRFSGK